jgi:5-methylcytosine-specific restriction enzyme A
VPEAIRTHKPRLKLPQQHGTLKARQGERTLALNGATWRKLRAVVLTRDPLCPRCRQAGYIERAVEVDHIDSDPSNNTLANLVGLCKLHHGQKTRQAGRETSPGTETARTVPRATRTPPHL